jgi:SAM-dependent methyltransferase
MSSAPAVSPPPQALRFITGTQKVQTYETTGGIVASQFAAYNLSLIPLLPKNAVVHDNACGTGIVSRLLLADGNPQNITIHATDVDPIFIAAISSTAKEHEWPVQVTNQKLQDLSFSNDFFDLSVTNLAIFFAPEEGTKQIYRTLKPGGTAVVNCWGYVAGVVPAQVTHEKMRPGKPFPIPGIDWSDGTKLQEIMIGAGFNKENMRLEKSEGYVELDGEDALREYVEKTWSFMGGVAGWLANDHETWDDAIDTFIASLRLQPGMEVVGDKYRLKGTQWVVVAKK